MNPKLKPFFPAGTKVETFIASQYNFIKIMRTYKQILKD